MEEHPPRLIDRQYHLYGWSQAALRTSFVIRELSCMFDAGLPSSSSIQFIFLTHGHSDHSGSLKHHSYSKTNRMIVFAPEPLAAHVTSYLEACKSLALCRPYQVKDTDPLVVGVVPGFTQDITMANKRFTVKAYKCYHSVPCVGYGLSEWKLETLPEFKGLSREEYIALKQNGTAVKRHVQKHTFVYLGDTTHEVFQDELVDGALSPSEVFKYSTIMVECTFLEPHELANAHETKHMHWQNLKPVILAHPECFFILFHFSRRYRTEQIAAFFEEQQVPNAFPWISR